MPVSVWLGLTDTQVTLLIALDAPRISRVDLGHDYTWSRLDVSLTAFRTLPAIGSMVMRFLLPSAPCATSLAFGPLAPRIVSHQFVTDEKEKHRMSGHSSTRNHPNRPSA